MILYSMIDFFFFFNDTATTEIYTLSLHDALPICPYSRPRRRLKLTTRSEWPCVSASRVSSAAVDRKSTRLNSSHLVISYAVFCLKKKNSILIIISLYSSILYYIIYLLLSTFDSVV